MNEPNVPLLRKAVEWVEAESEKPAIESEWFQGTWRDDGGSLLSSLYAADLIDEVTYESRPECGTAYCVAGYVAQMTQGSVNTQSVPYCENPVIGAIRAEGHAANVAMKELGITEEQAYRLFDGDNDAEDIRAIAEEITGERL